MNAAGFYAKRSCWGVLTNGCRIVFSALLASATMVFAASTLAEEDAGHITVAFGAEPTPLDPTRSSAVVDGYFIGLFYEPMLAITPDLERVSWLA